MVHYNQKYFETEGVTILEFGKGDIAVSSAESLTDKEAYLLFRSTPAGVIGEYNEAMKAGMNSNDVKPEVLMVFPKPESIDVVIETLKEAKKSLIKMLNQKTNDKPSVATGDASSNTDDNKTY
jgi:hypothetical protein